MKSDTFKKKLENLVISKSFSQIELTKYLIISGDKNPVHFGVNPILPGILILDYILSYFSPNPANFSIKFKNPLALKNMLYTTKITDKELIGFNNDNFIFQFIVH